MLDEYDPSLSAYDRRELVDEYLAEFDYDSPRLRRAAQARQDAWLAQSMVAT